MFITDFYFTTQKYIYHSSMLTNTITILIKIINSSYQIGENKLIFGLTVENKYFYHK